jgi:hypothetical protein
MSQNAGGGELRGLSQGVQLYTGAQINFGDQILYRYLTFGVNPPLLSGSVSYPDPHGSVLILVGWIRTQEVENDPKNRKKGINLKF